MNVCIIPVRSGSSRIKNKNISKINNSTILDRAIKVALNSKIFDKIFINSDSNSYLLNSKKFKYCYPYKREKKLSSNNIFLIDVIKDMIKKEKLPDDYNIGIILATSLLNKPTHVKKAFKKFKKNKFKTGVVSVTEYETPIQLAHYLNKNGELIPYFPRDYNFSTRSTDHKKCYKFNESIVFNTVRNLKKQNTLIGKKPIPYIMEVKESLVLDYKYQLNIARKLLK